ELLRFHVEIERAGVAHPAIDLELHRDVVGEAIAVEVNLSRGHLHVIAGSHFHAAFRVGFLRVAVELRLRAYELVRQAGRPVDGDLHVFERVPARLERHDALRANPRRETAGNRLRVLERLGFDLRLVRRALRGGDRLRDAAVLLHAAAIPADGDQENETEEGDGKRDAKNAYRALHASRNFLRLSGIPRVNHR